MPDQEGKLTTEERQRIIAWLEQYPKSVDAKCPVCGSETWMIAERLVQPVTLGTGVSLQLGGPGYPMVLLISNPCGYTRFLNAVMIGGLLPPAAESKKNPD